MLKKWLAWLKREPATAASPCPTATWPEVRTLPLTLHLQAGKLNDFMGLGDSYRVLSLLGRPSNARPYEVDRFEYPSLGLVIEGGDGKIEYFEFILQPESFEPQVTPAQVTLHFADGQRPWLDAQTDEAVIRKYFGNPIVRDADEDEIIMRYELEGRLLEWELTPQGKAKRFYVELEA